MFVLAGCNRVFGLEATEHEPLEASIPLLPDGNTLIDEDLDGILNEMDNCPGVPNPDQADTSDIAKGLPPDGVGDACDPDDSGTHEIVARYFFNDTGDTIRFSAEPAGAFTFHEGYVEIERTTDFAYLHGLDMPAFARGELTVEAGFELLDQEAGTKVGVYADGPQTHYAYVDLQPLPFLVAVGTYPPPDPCVPMNGTGLCDAESIPTLPERVVVQLRAGPANPKKDNLKAILAGTGIDTKADSSGTAMNTFGVVVKSAHARLDHVIVYRKL